MAYLPLRPSQYFDYFYPHYIDIRVDDAEAQVYATRKLYSTKILLGRRYKYRSTLFLAR